MSKNELGFGSREIPKAKPVIFHDSDLPSMASHCSQVECGYSLYRGVLIQWDEDTDMRVLTFVDELPEDVRSQLLVVQEHEASLGLLWNKCVPPNYEGWAEVIVEGDVWHIGESKVPRKL